MTASFSFLHHRRAALILFTAFALFVIIAPASAQRDKKKKKDEPPADTNAHIIPLPDEQKVDYTISEMLGAWQLGDAERMHKNYAEDVVIVSGAWTPPVLGWTNYLATYQQTRARMQQVRLDRSNTFIKVKGDVAWACYQWDFAAVVDGQPSAAQGQTTLVLQKVGDRWLIVHNHTSLAAPAPTPAPSAPQSAKP